MEDSSSEAPDSSPRGNNHKTLQSCELKIFYMQHFIANAFISDEDTTYQHVQNIQILCEKLERGQNPLCIFCGGGRAGRQQPRLWRQQASSFIRNYYTLSDTLTYFQQSHTFHNCALPAPSLTTKYFRISLILCRTQLFNQHYILQNIFCTKVLSLHILHKS